MPSLWVLYTCLILKALQPRIPSQCLTAFADDLLVQWTIKSPTHFHQVCKDVGYVRQVLRNFGTRISQEKAVLIVGRRGPAAARTLKQHVTTDPRKGKQFYIPQDPEIEQRFGVVRLPLVKQHTYLGIRISYQSYETLTLSHRLQQSWSAFHRLLPAAALKKPASTSELAHLAGMPICQPCLWHGLPVFGPARAY